ncbi:ABC transporter permease [Croceimicrobium sp.]|uniref:ABC transporter permease n=1 Tax=Croceimicrobium sp. TaxID=2828340 RepID=UPI003BA97A6F
MLRFIWNKTWYGLLVMWGVITVVFFLFNVLPGDPSRMMLDQREDSEQLARIKAKYGFDLPLGQQYMHYLNDLSPLSWHSSNPEDFSNYQRYQTKPIRLFKIGEGEFCLKAPYLRTSFRSQGKEVSTILSETFPNTLVLAIAAMTLALILGLSLGMVAARFKGSWIDSGISFFGTLGMSVPSFFSAILMAWIFGYLLSAWTGLNMTGSLYEADLYGEGRYIAWSNLILPAITLGIRPLAVIIQLSRSSILEELGQDYIRTARAKGLSMPAILRKHALRNALNPVITAASGWFASMLAGAVFVEYIFGWNGLGKQIVDALNQLDLPLVMGAVLLIAITFVVISIIVDLLYAWVDPRVRN